MQTLLLAASCAVLAGLAACGDSGATAAGPARGAEHGAAGLAPGATTLTFETPRIALGDTWEGVVLSHRFRARVGPVDLDLIGIKPDCGCAVPELSVLDGARRRVVGAGDELPAGSTIELLVRYDTQGRVGKQLRSIALFGNLPDGVARVEFDAEVRPWLIAEPTLGDLGRLRPSEERTATFRLRANDGSAVRLSLGDVQLPKGVSPALVPEEPRADGRARNWRLEVHVGAGLQRGRHRVTLPVISDRLRPDADDGNEATFATTLTLLVEGAGRLSLQPDVVRLGTLAPDQTVSRTVRLSVHEPGLRLAEPSARLVPATSEDVQRLGEGARELELARTVTITPRAVAGQPAWDLEILVRGLDDEVPMAFNAMLEVQTGFDEEPVLHALVQGIRER
ncbi:MAG: hypothetical protein WD226_10685 [Planctomycetota bacterium]